MSSGPEETGRMEGGVAGPSLQELRLTKFGCNLRVSGVASCLGWTGAVLRWEIETLTTETNQLLS